MLVSYLKIIKKNAEANSIFIKCSVTWAEINKYKIEFKY